MRIKKVPCARCKKLFDYELYSGLCPHCGCYHRAVGKAGDANLMPSPKTKVKPESGTLEAAYEKHIKQDKARGIDHYTQKH